MIATQVGRRWTVGWGGRADGETSALPRLGRVKRGEVGGSGCLENLFPV